LAPAGEENSAGSAMRASEARRRKLNGNSLSVGEEPSSAIGPYAGSARRFSRAKHDGAWLILRAALRKSREPHLRIDRRANQLVIIEEVTKGPVPAPRRLGSTQQFALL
jgi:hypothetical protein